MRFLPTGFDGHVVETIGGSDSEIEAMPEVAENQMPKESEKASNKSKKDRGPEDVNRGKARRVKKEKKRAQRD